VNLATRYIGDHYTLPAANATVYHVQLTNGVNVGDRKLAQSLRIAKR